jgi:DNA-binding HxlR family transcriptional regulator
VLGCVEVGKTYDQYCPIAHALDLVGERWSLLVVRELSHGPLRYTDLLARLGGCSTNILAARLKDLEVGGVIARRQLPPPAPAMVYELTRAGEGLRPVLRSLALWGARSLGPPADDEVMPADWLVRALETAVVPIAPAGRYQLVCGESRAALVDGAALERDVERPEATLAGSPRAFFALLLDGDLSGLEVTGSRAAARRLATAIAGEAVAAAQPSAARRSTSHASRTSSSVVR